ncbi:MAG: esterase/lipase family protein [Kangiellaceae bacterium]
MSTAIMTGNKKKPKSPSLIKLALEARTLIEAGGFALSYPILQTAPKGDGHPVLVMPGFMAGDMTTKLLRTFLKSRNYQSYGWNLGRNLGRYSDLEKGCGQEIIDRLKEIYELHGEKVSLIGWSLGGIYARELARLHPEMVRCVITLGSPFAGDLNANNVSWLFEKTSGYTLKQMDGQLRDRMRETPPVPSTAFFSKTDGITAWQCCIEMEDEQTENIEVQSSHCGLGHHPFVMWALADRLAQPEGEWKKFERKGLEHLMFR